MKFSEMTYVRPDIEAVSKEIKEIIERVKNAQSAGEQLQAHKDFTEICKKLESMNTIAYIRHTINTEDEFYDKEKDFYDENSPVIENLKSDFNKAFVSSKFRKELEENLGALLFRNTELELKSFDPAIIPELQEENRLTSEYVKLMASAHVETVVLMCASSEAGKC